MSFNLICVLLNQKLNLDLNKELSERKQECGELRMMHEETMKKMNILAMKDKENAGLSEQLSVLLKEIKELKLRKKISGLL